MLEIDWDSNFDPAYGIVYMDPYKYIYYRGYDPTHPVVSERPAYYGSFPVALSYVDEPHKKVSAFTNGQRLRLIDVRFMKEILRNLFDRYHPDDDSGVLSTVLSFGICSLAHQIHLASQRFQTSVILEDSMKSLRAFYEPSNYEQSGVRIAETTNDSETMGFLATLFSDFVDGFISPRQYTPFHVEKTDNIMNAEMILFNPAKSDVRITTRTPTGKISVATFYSKFIGRRIHVGEPEYPYTFLLSGGGGDGGDDKKTVVLPTVEQIHMRFDDDPEIQELWNRGVASGMRWKERARFGHVSQSRPTAPVTSWALVAPPPSAVESLRRKTRKVRR